MRKKIWLSAIVIAVTAGLITLKNIPVSSQSRIEFTKISFTNTASISPSPTYAGCGFMWAYHNDPEVSAKIDEAVRSINPAASAHAQLFGEDCVYADGHSTFSTMETDFYIRIPVEDLTAHEVFGDWIKKIVGFIIRLREDKEVLVQGRTGFAEFSFIKNDEEHLIVRVGINDYFDNAIDSDPLEVFQKYYTPTPPPTTPHPITPTFTPTLTR